MRTRLIALGVLAVVALQLSPPSQAGPAPGGTWQASLTDSAGNQMEIFVHGDVGSRVVSVRVNVDGEDPCVDGLDGSFEETPALFAVLDGTACDRAFQVEWTASNATASTNTMTPHVVANGDDCGPGSRSLRGHAFVNVDTPSMVAAAIDGQPVTGHGGWRSDATGWGIDQRLGPCTR